MPGVTQSLDELISSFHREVAAVTLGAEQSHVICKHRRIRRDQRSGSGPSAAAAASPFSQYGSPSSMWNRLFPNAFPQAAQTKQVVCQVCRRACITSCNTHTTHVTPCGREHGAGLAGGAPHPHDLGVAAGASGGEELAVAVLTVHVVLLLHEAHVGQRRVAVVAGELLGVPGPPEGHQEGAPGHVTPDRVLKPII